ncbi:MAG: prolipoprotein diacylglyceryl transferase [Ignavibacteriaceae bacterium]|nr:prolipoprotein diacylglyceryl transferase [Ignavibacteria bacterium]NNL21112.1 prolipoprotein diacylglyceryl transferase [Ignavibacteriaceae bacterium]
MYPELFKIGSLTVYSFGFMQVVGAIAATIILYLEAKRKGLDIYYTLEVLLLSVCSILIGGKLFYLIEIWSSFIKNPLHYALNFSGSTYYGGFILGTFVFYLYLKIKKIPFLFAADSVAPALPVTYGFGRIGCHLSGDGCYGIPTDLPWGTNFENGTMPPSLMCRNTDVAQAYQNGIVPDNTPLHPTSVYEALVAAIIFIILWKSRKKDWADGKLFALYLILSSAARFLVEFIRLNPRILFGLSEAQLIAIVLGTVGLFGFYKLSNKTS